MLYSEGRMVTKAVDCYRKMKNWDAILNCVKNHESDFTQEQREQLIKKYVPLALNSLYTLITHDEDINVSGGEDESDQEEDKQRLILQAKENEGTMNPPPIFEEEEDEEDD
jgi:hypothetical protein